MSKILRNGFPVPEKLSDNERFVLSKLLANVEFSGTPFLCVRILTLLGIKHITEEQARQTEHLLKYLIRPYDRLDTWMRDPEIKSLGKHTMRKRWLEEILRENKQLGENPKNLQLSSIQTDTPRNGRDAVPVTPTTKSDI